MNQIVIMCTCTENNGQYYLRNIRNWYDHLKAIDADFYVINDGSKEELSANGISEKYQFYKSTPILCRKSLSMFP